jgi:hypothetical protein
VSSRPVSLDVGEALLAVLDGRLCLLKHSKRFMLAE